MKSNYLLVVICMTVCILSACTKDHSFSPVPDISFSYFNLYKNVAGKDTTVDFVFTFKDGDGDIGTPDNELDTSCGANNNNLFISYYEKRGNDFYPKRFWTQVVTVTTNCDTITKFDSVQVAFNQRMQYVEPASNRKSIEGTVTYKMDYNSAVIFLSSVGRFDFYIKDRAGHLSNKVTTPELVINK